MAYDVACRVADIFPTNKLSADFAKRTGIWGDFEPELKFGIIIRGAGRGAGAPFFVPPSPAAGQATEMLRRAAWETHMATIKAAFTSLHACFNEAAGDVSDCTHILAHDGLHPNDYTLVSLGMDTADRKIAANGYQYRERFALPHDLSLPTRDSDVNAKTFLSAPGLHRLEFEAPIRTLGDGFPSFLEIPGIPDFFQTIEKQDLRIEAICLTSRTTFLSLAKVPSLPLYLELLHCCDVNLYTTPHADVMAGGDIEWETEVRRFYGDHPATENCAEQHRIIDLCFADITARFNRQGIGGVTLLLQQQSKMERALDAVDRWYKRHGPLPEQGRANPRIPSGIAQALAQGKTATNVLHDGVTLGNLRKLAANLPKAEFLLDPEVAIAARHDIELACH